MRSIVAALGVSLALIGCSPRDSAEEAPPAPPAIPMFELALSSPDQLTVLEGSPIRITQGEAGLRFEGHVANPGSSLRTEGASVAMGTENEAAFGGNFVRISFVARGVDGATAFQAAYSTNGSGNSGWQTLNVTPEFSTVFFDFATPPVVEPMDDFLGINPPVSGAVEIQSIRVEIVPQPSVAAPADEGELRQ